MILRGIMAFFLVSAVFGTSSIPRRPASAAWASA